MPLRLLMLYREERCLRLKLCSSLSQRHRCHRKLYATTACSALYSFVYIPEELITVFRGTIDPVS